MEENGDGDILLDLVGISYHCPKHSSIVQQDLEWRFLYLEVIVTT